MNGSKRKRAGTGERMQYLVHSVNDNTIRFVLCYPGLIDAQALRDAMLLLVGSVDVLHASFRSGRVGASWRVHREVDESSCFLHVRTAGDPAQTALSLSLTPIPPESRTQMRCFLVQSDTASAIALCISHLCVDGSDGKYLLGKLAEAYAAVRAGQQHIEVKNGSRAAEQVYRDKELREIVSLMKSPMTGVKSTYPFPSEGDGMRRVVYRTIPAELMERARSLAKACGASANDLLLTACYHALAAMPGADPDAPVSVMSMIDLRRHCAQGESAGLSNLSGALPTLLETGVQGDFADTLRCIAAQTARIKEDPQAGLMGMPLLHGAVRMMPMGLLTMVASRIYGSMSVGLTNLGRIDGEAMAMDGVRPDAGWFGGPLKKKPGMQVSAASFDGVCTLCIYGSYTQEDADSLTAFLAQMVRCLTDFAAQALTA